MFTAHSQVLSAVTVKAFTPNPLSESEARVTSCKSRRKGAERLGQVSGSLPALRPPGHRCPSRLPVGLLPGAQAGPEGLFPAGLQ